jgi:hypothetical protein
MVDLGQNPIFAPLLNVKLETLAPSWAIFDALAHLIFVHAWEKLVVLN